MNVSKADIPKGDDKWTRWCLFLGITIWFTDLNTVYALPSLACQWGWFSFKFAGLSGLVIVEGIISLVAILLILLMIYLPWRDWHRVRAERAAQGPGILTETEKDRHSLMPFVVVLVNAFFLLFIIATFVPMVLLNACAQG